MERLKEFDLIPEIKDNLICLEAQQCPGLFELSEEDLLKIIYYKKYSGTQYYSDHVSGLENDICSLEEYYKAKF